MDIDRPGYDGRTALHQAASEVCSRLHDHENGEYYDDSNSNSNNNNHYHNRNHNSFNNHRYNNPNHNDNDNDDNNVVQIYNYCTLLTV